MWDYSDSDTRWYQCLLEKTDGSGSRMVAWIQDIGAGKGRIITLKDDEGTYIVKEVFSVPLKEETVRYREMLEDQGWMI